MPFPAFSEIDPSRISPVSFSNGKIQPVFCLRNKDEMDMIGHQTIRPCRNMIRGCPFRHQFKINTVIVIIEKCLLTPVSTLCDMMGHSRCHRPCDSCHVALKPDYYDFAIIIYGAPGSGIIIYDAPRSHHFLKNTDNKTVLAVADDSIIAFKAILKSIIDKFN